MHDGEADNRIQPPPIHVTPPLPAAPAGDEQCLDDLVALKRGYRHSLVSGMLFGAYAGLLAGAIMISACCWLADLYEWRWQGLLIGGAVGPFGGALAGIRERKARGILTRPDIATFICVIYGLLPAVVVLANGLGLVSGKLSGLLYVGGFFAGPMFGMLIGAALDRSYEVLHQRAWASGLLRMAIVTIVCVGIGAAIMNAPYGPDPDDLLVDVRRAIRAEWKTDPVFQHAKIQGITLHRAGGREYAGVVDATVAGNPVQLGIDVVVREDRFTWRLQPLANK